MQFACPIERCAGAAHEIGHYHYIVEANQRSPEDLWQGSSPFTTNVWLECITTPDYRIVAKNGVVSDGPRKDRYFHTYGYVPKSGNPVRKMLAFKR